MKAFSAKTRKERSRPDNQAKFSRNKSTDRAKQNTKSRQTSPANFSSHLVGPTPQSNHALCLENQANQIADGVISGIKTIANQPAPSKSTHALPRLTTTIKQNSANGHSLMPSIRHEMESFFNADFSGVRIHLNDQSARLNDHLNARAFTFGDHIYFNRGQFDPSSKPGKHLVAHELTHVLQQRLGDTVIQRQDPEPGVRFWFNVNVNQEMDSDTLLLTFVMQYRRVDVATARELITSESWRWSNGPQTVSAEEAAQGYKLLHIQDGSIRAATRTEERQRRRAFAGFSRRDRRAINQETDRQFWERTNYRPGEQLGRSEDDRRMAQFWRTLRSEIIRQRIAIDNLPQEIRDFMFSGTGRTIQPQDYQTVLRIADKLMQLSAEERAAYLARTTGSTTDLNAFETAIDRFRAMLQERFRATLESAAARDALLGLDEIYDRYLLLVSLRQSASGNAAIGLAVPGSGAAGTSIGMNSSIRDLEQELTQALQPHGYNSLSDFEQAIRTFELTFQNAAVFTALDMLDRYDHLLWTQQERYRQSGVGSNLHSQLDQARQHVERAHEIRNNHAMGVVLTPEEMAEQAYWSGQFNQELAAGRQQVRSLSGDHPLLSDRDFPFEDLALASENRTATVMQDFIRRRRENVSEVRTALDDNPEIIWDLDMLLPQAMAEQGIRQNSIYHKIIQHHIRQRNIDHALINLAIAVFAIAAGIVSMGTGTVAVLGAGAAFGISAYQAWEEFQRYELQHAAHGAQLLSDDPSFAWVVVAIVGAGVDMAGVAAALRPMRAAINNFNQTTDILRLQEELAVLPGLNSQVRASVIRSAQVELEARNAWRAARARHFGNAYSYLDPLVTPLLHLAVNFTYPVYLQIRRGIIGLENFLRGREAISLLGQMHNLSPQQLAKIRNAYRLAMRNAQEVAAHGHGLGMSQAEIEYFLLAWNRHPNLSAEDVIRNMNQWAAPLADNPNSRARLASDMILDDASRTRLADFDQQIAGTGGIESIRVRDSLEGGVAITIEGEVIPGRLVRRGTPGAGQRRAPDFNSSSSLIGPGEAGLNRNWQLLHLWGPGFGDEAAAGIMMGPRNVNLVWQNSSIENYIREVAELSRRHGGRTRVRATAIAWENPTPSGWSAPHGIDFLKQVEYEVTLIRPGGQVDTVRISLDVAEPPGTSIRNFSIDPPSAANLGDLF